MRTTRSRTAPTCRARHHGCAPATTQGAAAVLTSAAPDATTEPSEAVERPANGAGLEPAPGTPEALALLAELGIAPRAAAGEPLGPDDARFCPVALGHLTHRLVEVKRMLEQLGVEQNELQETLRLAHLRGDLLHLQRPSDEGGGYKLPEGRCSVAVRAASSGATSPVFGELEAQLKAQQVYEQATGDAHWSYGAAFWEVRFAQG